MKIKNLFIIPVLMMSMITDSFKEKQLKNERVKTAYDQKSEAVFALLAQNKLKVSQLRIFLRVFKQEKVVEIWAKNETDAQFLLLKTYPFAASSGVLGPKRKQGDMQTPEGFYFIDRFNPLSNFHLSLGVNYPNDADRIKGEKGNLGGDIFIHGSNVTVGCIPLTDTKIEEVYLLAVEAKNAGQYQIAVHIFPTHLDENGLAKLKILAENRDFKTHWSEIFGGQTIDSQKFINFWTNLQNGFLYFEKNHQLPKMKVKTNGDYEVL
jgi:murein L,D-transpeptidase YafK